MKPVIIMAMREESQGLIEKAGFEVHYSGIGKINAAHALMRLLSQKKDIPFVLNLGSAGSGTFKTGEIVGAHQFVQRDMDATGLGFKHGETPYDPCPALIEFKPHFTHLRHGICGSGDSFLQGPSPLSCDIIDMEAYALAKICHMENVPFACVKYITDGADGGAHTEWQENLRHAAHEFVLLLEASQNY